MDLCGDIGILAAKEFECCFKHGHLGPKAAGNGEAIAPDCPNDVALRSGL